MTVSAAALLAAAVVSGAEMVAEIGPGLRGAWLTPDKQWDGRALLMLHGFADDRDGAGDLAKRFAEALAKEGIATLRIDFRGEGDRRRTHIESTAATRVADAEAAREFLLRQPGVAPMHIGVWGWSLGGTTALQVAGRHPDWFRTMALWSSPTGDQEKFMLRTEVAQRALRDGEASEEVPGWKTIVTKREFYESFRGVDLNRAASNYAGALLSVRGSLDPMPADDRELLNAARGESRTAVLVGGADHIFNVFDPAKPHASEAVRVTVEWLRKTL